MIRKNIWLLSTMVLFFLTGCGVTGDLYLPQEETQETVK